MIKPNGNDTSGQEGVTLDSRREGPVAVISIKGSSQPAYSKQLQEIFERFLIENVFYFILDLSEARLINSQQIGLIVQHIQNLSNYEKSGFAFVNPTDRVLYLLEITRASDLAYICNSVDEALQHFGLAP